MIDLHLHTTASDGVLSPTQLVESASERGMEVVSITDHDTIDGLREGMKRANELDIKFINGIELSSEWEGKEVHVLGYFLNIEDEEFLKELDILKEARDARNVKILAKLKEYDIHIEMKEVEAEAGGEILSRAHIAMIMLEKGYALDKKEVFTKYLGIDGVAYVPKGDLTPERAVEIIRNNGGIASIAHPKYISPNPDKVRKLIDRLKPHGLEGLEVFYSNMFIRDILKYKKLAKSTGLISTGGSDYHGTSKVNVEIGDGNVPFSVYRELLKRNESR